MEPDWGPAGTPEAQRVWAEAIPPLAAALREDAHDLSIGMAERIGADLPELVADADGQETNRASNEANILLVAELLELGADPRAVELPAPTLAYATVGAHRNLPLPGLIRAYRIGHLYLWERILEYLRGLVPEPDDFATVVALVSSWLHLYVDAALCLGEEVYNRERERWLRSTSALRAETITAIVDGEPMDPDAASLRLGYELGRVHVGIVAWLEQADDALDPVGILEAALARAAERAGGSRPLVHQLGLVTAAAWIGSHDGWDARALEAITTDADDLAPARIAIGEPASGIDGFRSTHREAMQARRVVALAGRPPGTATRYADVALTALTTADLEQARVFIGRHLGALAAADETSRRLASTARAYLDEGASHGRAAARLGIHENTVRYRVRQVEDMLERPIGPGDLDLRVALALLETGPAL